VGRPARFAITDHHERTFTLPAESFRNACNYSRPIPLEPGQRLKSSLVHITLRGDQVVFTGQGFGHGVGLSQWGAQAMAADGRDVIEILATFYPGASIERAY
jgi:SpoIID/LytB domain protein